MLRIGCYLISRYLIVHIVCIIEVRKRSFACVSADDIYQAIIVALVHVYQSMCFHHSLSPKGFCADCALPPAESVAPLAVSPVDFVVLLRPSVAPLAV